MSSAEEGSRCHRQVLDVAVSIYVPAILAHIAHSIPLAIGPKYLLDDLGRGPRSLGMVLTCGSICGMCSNLPAGRITGCLGTSLGQAVSSVLGIIGSLLFIGTGFLVPSQDYETPNIILCTAGFGFMYSSTAVGVIARTAAVAEADVAPGQRGRVSSWTSGMNRLGLAIGPTVGGIAGMRMLSHAFRLQLGIYCVYGLWIILVSPRKKVDPAQDRGKEGGGTLNTCWERRSLINRAAFAIIALGTMRTGRMFLMPVCGHQRNYSVIAIGAASSASFLADTMMIPAAGELLDTIGTWKTISIAITVMGIGICIFCSLSFSLHGSSFWGAYMVGVLVTGLGNGTSAGSVIKMSIDLSPPDLASRSTFAALFRTINSSSDAILPGCLGFALHHWLQGGDCGFVFLNLGLTLALVIVLMFHPPSLARLFGANAAWEPLNMDAPNSEKIKLEANNLAP